MWRLFYKALLPHVPCHDCPPGDEDDDDEEENDEEEGEEGAHFDDFLQPVKYRCSRCKRERYRIEMEEVNSFLILILTRAARNNSSLNPGGGYPSHYHPISCLF